VVELDRKLASVFKTLSKAPLDQPSREKVDKQFRAVRDRVLDQGFAKKIEGLFQDLCRPPAHRRKPDAEEVLENVRNLRDRGFVETAALLFVTWREILSGLKLERVLPAAPDAACLEAWMKAAKAPAQEVEKHLLAEPVATYATAGAEGRHSCRPMGK
jgi:hypothetical protein